MQCQRDRCHSQGQRHVTPISSFFSLQVLCHRQGCEEVTVSCISICLARDRRSSKQRSCKCSQHSLLDTYHMTHCICPTNSAKNLPSCSDYDRKRAHTLRFENGGRISVYELIRAEAFERMSPAYCGSNPRTPFHLQ